MYLIIRKRIKFRRMHIRAFSYRKILFFSTSYGIFKIKILIITFTSFFIFFEISCFTFNFIHFDYLLSIFILFAILIIIFTLPFLTINTLILSYFQLIEINLNFITFFLNFFLRSF